MMKFAEEFPLGPCGPRRIVVPEMRRKMISRNEAVALRKAIANYHISVEDAGLSGEERILKVDSILKCYLDILGMWIGGLPPNLIQDIAKKQRVKSPLKEVLGKWPGDESIEEILDVLRSK